MIARENSTEVNQSMIDLLFIAAKSGDVDAAQADGVTALHVAAEFDYTKVVEVLLAAGANVNAKNIDNKAPLYVATQNHHLGVMRGLLAAGANVHQPYKLSYALHRAAKDEWVAGVRLLISDDLPHWVERDAKLKDLNSADLKIAQFILQVKSQLELEKKYANDVVDLWRHNKQTFFNGVPKDILVHYVAPMVLDRSYR